MIFFFWDNSLSVIMKVKNILFFKKKLNFFFQICRGYVCLFIVTENEKWYLFFPFSFSHSIFSSDEPRAETLIISLILTTSLSRPVNRSSNSRKNPKFWVKSRTKMQRKGSNQRLSGSGSSNLLLRSRISTLMLSMFATIASFYVAGRLVNSLIW